MGFRMLDEKTMLVTSSEQFPTFPDRPEPTRREAKKLKRPAAAKHLNMSEADFDLVPYAPGISPKPRHCVRHPRRVDERHHRMA